MYKSLATLVAYSLFFQQSNAQDMAVATFSAENSGIEGYVKVTNQMLSIYLNTTQKDNDTISDPCLDGVKFHIHQRWDYNNTKDRLTDECGRDYTGNHWDPWLGCGGATDNVYCSVNSLGVDDRCVTGSSVLGGSTYDCSTSTFSDNPYACEVGDWNGKYGVLSPDENGIIDATFSSPYEAQAFDLQGLSVVFHCGLTGAPRSFCAPFEYSVGIEDTGPTQSDNYDMVAYFSSTSYVMLQTNGSYEITVDPGDFTIPGGCGDLLVRVYDDWTSDSMWATSMCSSYTGDGFYDPTVTCAYGSSNQFCTDNLLCNISNYNYTCDTITYGEPATRFNCAPGDFTGKYGSLSSSAADSKMGVDAIQIDLSQLSGRSAVLQCSSDWSMVACGGFEAVGDSDVNAVAWFDNDNTGVDGYVKVTDGNIKIYLDITELAESGYDGIADNASCFTSLKYHIHELWTYNDTIDRLQSDCARGDLGNHWDPWLGCGGATDNDYCTNDAQSTKDTCVPGSSVLGDSGYDCTTSTFATNPYACEVGDWSGKYGAITPNGYVFEATVSSPYEVTGADLINGGYSVVFHCATDGAPRAFCAVFQELDAPDTDTRPTQESLGNEDVQAWWDANNYLILRANGSYELMFDVGTAFSACDQQEGVYYRIYDSCDSGAKFYDPTASCAPMSNSEYCYGDDSTRLCNDTSYSYTCNTMYPYTCAPGDLSGKYGTLPLGEDAMQSLSGTDDLMIDLSLLPGMGLALTCGPQGDYSIETCQTFTTVSSAMDDMTTTAATEPMGTSDASGGSPMTTEGEPEDDDSGVFAMTVQFATIIAIIGSMAIMFV